MIKGIVVLILIVAFSLGSYFVGRLLSSGYEPDDDIGFRITGTLIGVLAMIVLIIIAFAFFSLIVWGFSD